MDIKLQVFIDWLMEQQRACNGGKVAFVLKKQSKENSFLVRPFHLYANTHVNDFTKEYCCNNLSQHVSYDPLSTHFQIPYQDSQLFIVTYIRTLTIMKSEYINTNGTKQMILPTSRIIGGTLGIKQLSLILNYPDWHYCNYGYQLTNEINHNRVVMSSFDHIPNKQEVKQTYIKERFVDPNYLTENYQISKKIVPSQFPVLHGMYDPATRK